MIELFQNIAGGIQAIWGYISNGFESIGIGLRFLVEGVAVVPLLANYVPPIFASLMAIIVAVAIVKILLNIFL